jgi:glycosyltransferase involved in cell wall biosynthesis
MAGSSISITVGIPTYNRLNYLKESTASALAQTYPNMEILISQNPHPDRLVLGQIADYCQTLARSDSRIRYQLLDRDVGPPANFNAIANAAGGNYLMMIGDDDRLLPDAVDNLGEKVSPSTALAFGKRHVINSDGKRVESYSEVQPGGFGAPPVGRLANPEFWAWQQAMATETSLIRTRDFRRIPFRENVDMPDMEFFILLARERGEFNFVPKYVTEIRVHPDSTTGRGFVNYRELADLLFPLEVAKEVEVEKARKLKYLTHMAVLRCMSDGEVRDARRLLRSKYYCDRALATRLCSTLPGRLAAPTYRAYNWMRSQVIP